MARVTVAHILHVDDGAGIVGKATLFASDQVARTRCRARPARNLIDTSRESTLL